MINRKLPSKKLSNIIYGRASAFTSAKASITIEAAMAVPLFFYAVICLIYLMEIMAIQTAVRSGVQYAGKELAKESYLVAAVMPSKLERDIVEAVGADRLDRSIVVGGSGGIHCQGTRMSAKTGICQVSASYQIRLPIPFGVTPVTYRTEMKIKGWTGFEKTGWNEQDETTVYITENGLVYHQNYHCTYLDLSIRMVENDDLDSLRNSEGGKYYPCERCAKGTIQGVYITDTGNRYHGSLGCSGLKRTVYAVPLPEAVGKGACSRCGK